MSGSPLPSTQPASCVRDDRPSLVKMCSMWDSTVRLDRKSRSAISRLTRPSATRTAICLLAPGERLRVRAVGRVLGRRRRGRPRRRPGRPSPPRAPRPAASPERAGAARRSAPRRVRPARRRPRSGGSRRRPAPSAPARPAASRACRRRRTARRRARIPASPPGRPTSRSNDIAIVCRSLIDSFSRRQTSTSSIPAVASPDSHRAAPRTQSAVPRAHCSPTRRSGSGTPRRAGPRGRPHRSAGRPRRAGSR